MPAVIPAVKRNTLLVVIWYFVIACEVLCTHYVTIVLLYLAVSLFEQSVEIVSLLQQRCCTAAAKNTIAEKKEENASEERC